MSLIHKAAHERVMEKGLDGQTLLDLMEFMAADAETFEKETGQMMIGYLDEDDEFETGTYVPEVWIIVRKVLDD